MNLVRPRRNWTLLLLLGLSCYLVEWGFGYALPFSYTGGTYLPDSPQPFLPTVYPWSWGLIFSAVMAVIFLFCLNEPQQRQAAFVAFGLSVLLSGPSYTLNAARLAQISPASSPWLAPHLPIWLALLCWGGSAGLLYWWLSGPVPIRQQGPLPLLLFTCLLFILLVMPALANWFGVESMGFLTALPSTADEAPKNPDALTQLLVEGFAGALGDILLFLVQWIGLIFSLFAVIVLVPGMWAKRSPTPVEVPGALILSGPSFPCHMDLVPILWLFTGGLLFPIISALMGNLSVKIEEVAKAVHRPLYEWHAGFYAVQVLDGLVFLTGLVLVLRRLRTAANLRFSFTMIILVASSLLSIWSMFAASRLMAIVGLLGLALCVWQGLVFFHWERRPAWVESTFAVPSETAMKFAIQGALILAMLFGAFFAIAIELAMASVIAINYLLSWGAALRLPHGIAQVEKIAPAFAPTLSATPIVLGPVYFSGCILVSVGLVLLFSLFYVSWQICVKIYYIKQIVDMVTPDAYPEVPEEKEP